MLGRSALRGMRVRVKSPMEPGENCASNLSDPPFFIIRLFKNFSFLQVSVGFGRFGIDLQMLVLRSLRIL